jgi:glycosyltransferase involved in cell wall biosynthesis
MVAEALGALGTVDICLPDKWRSSELEEEWPEWVGDAEWCRVEASRYDVRAVLGRASPVSLRIGPDARHAAQLRFFSRRYDLTWCVDPRAYAPVAGLVTRPVVLDLHNVISSSLRHKRRLLVRRPWLAANWSRKTVDLATYRPGIERRWRAWEADAVRSCDRVTVCSDVDRSLIGGTASVVPNCYRRPTRPAALEHTPHGPLCIGFVGRLFYRPNFDAVRWFADRVFPRVLRFERDAEFRVIGQAGPGLQDLGRRRGVRLLGHVPELEVELAQLSVLVAPIRFGGGTRFKILEAFAHGIPMVSTTIGAEGIDARDGEHVLLRDDPATFAQAIVDLHRDPGLRDRLITAAAGLYESRYTWEHGVAAVQQVVAELTASPDVASDSMASLTS